MFLAGAALSAGSLGWLAYRAHADEIPTAPEPSAPESPLPAVTGSPAPETTASPEALSSPAPEVSAAPEAAVSPAPEASPTPEAAAAPTASPSPEAAAAPLPEASPEVVAQPEASPSPEALASPAPVESPVAAEPTPEPSVEAPPPASAVPPELVQLPQQEAPNNVSTNTFERASVPAYKTAVPQFGIEISSTLRALKDLHVHPDETGDARLRAFSGQFEYQPAFIQPIGVVDLGVGGTVYTFLPKPYANAPAVPIWSAGGQARYQARFFREQPLVPWIGYSAEFWNYTVSDSEKGHFLAKGPFVGAGLLLNWFEPSAAAEMYDENGISRTYLIGEVRYLSTKGDALIPAFDGKSIYFGLRFEL